MVEILLVIVISSFAWYAFSKCDYCWRFWTIRTFWDLDHHPMSQMKTFCSKHLKEKPWLE